MDMAISSPPAASSFRAATESLSSHFTSTGVVPIIIFIVFSPSRPSDRAHARISSAVLRLSIRVTSSHSASPAETACRFFALEPAPLEAEVQNGITVLPPRSIPSTRVYRIFGACPCQIG